MKITKEQLKRAIGYALSLVSFQEVGMGADEELGNVRAIVYSIIGLCERETGIKLSGYPTEFLRAHKDLLTKEKLPYTLLRIFEEKK